MTGTTVGPEDAYRFAKGAEVVSSPGQPVKLSRRLAFPVVADHSDNMGLAPDFFAGKPEMLEFEYARSALQNGLKMEAKFGVNPFKIGLIGSTDAHTGLIAVEEDSFVGKTVSAEPSPTMLFWLRIVKHLRVKIPRFSQRITVCAGV